MQDLSDNPDEWENTDMASFLDAMVSWLEATDDSPPDKMQPAPNLWRMLAFLLIVGRDYE